MAASAALILLVVPLLVVPESSSFLLPRPPGMRTKHYHPSPPRIIAQSQSSALRASADESADDIVLRLPLLEAEHATTDDDERRAALEEEIGHARTAAEFGVRRAQVDFYAAFSGQDAGAMREVWSAGDDVRCVHPGMPSIGGLDNIMASWETLFKGEPFEIEPERTTIDVCGGTALCSCVEGTPGGGKLEALNVYRREGGRWRMTLHMASPIFGQQ